MDIEQTLKEGVSDKGGWNAAQFALIGIAWPPIKGWKRKLVKDKFSVSSVVHAQFLALRNETVRSKM